jgi:hypothetical protein
VLGGTVISILNTEKIGSMAVDCNWLFEGKRPVKENVVVFSVGGRHDGG